MKESEKYYIVYFNSITQYSKTNKGYYVSYKDKCEDNYSENFVFAKRYKTLGSALNRAYVNYKGTAALKIMRKIEAGEAYLPEDVRIEVIRIDNMRKRKLSKLKGESGEAIRNLGVLPTEELYKFLQKEVDKACRSDKYFNPNAEPEKNATQEDIDDFCSHMDNVHNKFENI
jgi:hypothetical protein